MEYFEKIKVGVEIRRTLTTCDDVELARFMQKLTELLIKSDQKNLIYKFIVNVSHTQSVDILHKMERILPTDCNIQDSITQSSNIIATQPKFQNPKQMAHNHKNKVKNYEIRTNQTCNILNSISSDVLLSILNYLTFPDMLSLQNTCRYFLRECLHPNALYELQYSFDNEHIIPRCLPFNQLRFANIFKLCVSHEFGEYDREITDTQFNPLWFKNVKELSCLFATEYVDCCNFIQYLESDTFQFEAVKKLAINLVGQHGSNWLNLIINNVINTACLQHLYLTHILESVDLMKLILNCKQLQVLSVNNLDFPTFEYFDSIEYEEFFAEETIALPNIQNIIYVDNESCVGICEWMQFIGHLIENTQQNKVDLCVSYRCLDNKDNYVSNVLFADQLKSKQIIQKLNNVYMDVDDAMVPLVIHLADKLLEFGHSVNDIHISGMIIQKDLDLELLYQKYKVLFQKCHRTFLSFSDYYHYDSHRMTITNPIFLSWIQRLISVSPKKVFIDFKSKR